MLYRVRIENTNNDQQIFKINGSSHDEAIKSAIETAKLLQFVFPNERYRVLESSIEDMNCYE